jgi:hypothetical protein
LNGELYQSQWFAAEAWRAPTWRRIRTPSRLPAGCRSRFTLSRAIDEGRSVFAPNAVCTAAEADPAVTIDPALIAFFNGDLDAFKKREQVDGC